MANILFTFEKPPLDDSGAAGKRSLVGRPDCSRIAHRKARDKHYAFGLTMALVANGVCLDVIGKRPDRPAPRMAFRSAAKFLNLYDGRVARGWSRRQSGQGIAVVCPARPLCRQLRSARTPHFMGLQIPFFDRTVLMIYYRL